MAAGVDDIIGGSALQRPADRTLPPTAGDPMGTKPNPESVIGAIEAVIDARIERCLTGRSSTKFDGVPDVQLVHELIARGWAVFRPQANQ